MYATLYGRLKLGKQLVVSDNGGVKTVAYRTYVTLGDYKAKANEEPLHGRYYARLVISGKSTDQFWNAITQGSYVACPYSIYSINIIELPDGSKVPELVLATKLENISIPMVKEQSKEDHISKQAARVAADESESIDLAPEIKYTIEKIINDVNYPRLKS